MGNLLRTRAIIWCQHPESRGNSSDQPARPLQSPRACQLVALASHSDTAVLAAPLLIQSPASVHGKAVEGDLSVWAPEVTKETTWHSWLQPGHYSQEGRGAVHGGSLLPVFLSNKLLAHSLSGRTGCSRASLEPGAFAGQLPLGAPQHWFCRSSEDLLAASTPPTHPARPGEHVDPAGGQAAGARGRMWSSRAHLA